MIHQCRYVTVVIVATLFFSMSSLAAKNLKLEDMSFEKLMDMDVVVTSPARRQQAIGDVASAIFVITEKDIKRSGATSIPELLRMAPGIHVARINNQTWAVSARGFNDRFANKLLVLIDGRSVYSQLFSGVDWDEPDALLEDLERIEVIRGPGGTIWGSNAVNGVINIITKQAKATQGAQLIAGYGNQEQYFGSGRYGGQLNDKAFYRLYVKGFSRDAYSDSSGFTPGEDWDQVQGGGRLDWQSGKDAFTVQGDAYSGKTAKSFTVRTPDPTPGLVFGGDPSPSFAAFADTIKFDGDTNGVNVLARWEREFSADSALRLQFYYDHAYRNFQGFFEQERQQYDIEFQHYFAPLPGHLLTWGGGYRRNDADTKGQPGEVEYNPSQHTNHTWNAFIQEEFSVIDDVLTLTLGSKFEHNSFTGFEIQPSARFLWKLLPNHTLWGAVSRTTRTPSQFEHNGNFNVLLAGTQTANGTLLASSLRGNENFESEQLVAYELGYRAQLFEQFSIDITGFYNVYDNLRSFKAGAFELQTNPQPDHFIIPLNYVNKAQAHSFGIEIASNWRVNEHWELKLAYTYFTIDFDKPDNIILLDSLELNPPTHLVSLRSLFEICADLNLDLWFRYSDALGSAGIVDSFVTLDARLAWQATKNLELSVVGHNLFEDTRPEGQLQFSNSPPPLELERSFFVQASMSF